MPIPKNPTGTTELAVLGLGGIAGVGVALRGLGPTGSAGVDWVLIVVATTGAVWSSTRAPWWALSALAGLTVALAPSWPASAVALAVLVLSLGAAATVRRAPVRRSRADRYCCWRRLANWVDGGFNSLVAVGAVAVVAGLGMWRRSPDERRPAIYVVGAVAATAAIAALGLVAAVLAARPDLSTGNREAHRGLDLVKTGEFELAQEAFERAAAAFDRADNDLRALWAQPARLLPIASQHHRAGVALSAAAAAATDSIHQQLRAVDLDSLSIVDGRIDIDAVRALHAPMAELQLALDEFEVSVDAAYDDWLSSPVLNRLDDLAADIDEQQALGDKALAALEVAPTILGADGEQVYFVMFTTPAEARGQGGFMGNWAELSFDDGRIEMTRFGADQDLNRGGDRPRYLRHVPDDWMTVFGRFGYFKGEDGHVGEQPWMNLTMSPDFPATAQVVAELYPQSGGREIHGVISLDIFVLERIIDLVGPLDVEGVPEPLTGENSAEFLLLGQYVDVDPGRRGGMLEAVTRQTVDLLLETAPPDPLALGRALAPMVDRRRLLAWSPHAAVQAVIADAGLDGGLLDGRAADVDALAVYVNNASASKIETFLEREFHYDVDAGADGSVSGVLTLGFANTAPADGYPGYVIGNAIGMPEGTSKLLVMVASPLPLCAAELDGVVTEIQQWTHEGFWSYEVWFEIPPLSSRELRLELRGQLAPSPDGDYRLDVQHQPLVNDEVWSFDGVVVEDGRPRAEGFRVRGATEQATVPSECS